MPVVTVENITDAWWKANMLSGWKSLGGTGVGEHLRKYEAALATLKKNKIPIPPAVTSNAVVEGFKKLSNHATLSKEAATAYKALFEVEKLLKALGKNSRLPEPIASWRAVVDRQRIDMMVLSDNLK